MKITIDELTDKIGELINKEVKEAEANKKMASAIYSRACGRAEAYINILNLIRSENHKALFEAWKAKFYKL